MYTNINEIKCIWHGIVVTQLPLIAIVLQWFLFEMTQDVIALCVFPSALEYLIFFFLSSFFPFFISLRLMHWQELV